MLPKIDSANPAIRLRKVSQDLVSLEEYAYKP